MKQFVKISRKPQDIASALTLKTAEVEGFRDFSEQYKNVVTGKILEFKKLEGSDKLHISKVDVGTHVAQILFGTVHGVQPGWIVPVALPGARLPNGMEIQKRKMMGIKSQGMLCADDELGLELSDTGFMVFPEGTKTGIPLAKALGLDDVVLEIDNKSLSHRPDLWGQVGFAREIAAITGAKFVEPKVPTWKQLARSKSTQKLRAKIVTKKACSRYMAVRIDGIKITPSQSHIRSRLLALGLRPISNVVDITNYVMYEMGQPLHAFDAAKVMGGIQVRTARAGEKLQTIDVKLHELKETDLLIADDVKGVALAGIMGGANSEISASTTSIILEAATFDAATIRTTAKRLGINTDASQRFEKTLDPELADIALRRAVELILETCEGAVVTSAVVDAKNYTKKKLVVSLTHESLEHQLGTRIPQAKVASILQGLGFSVSKSKAAYKITVPSYRATKDIRAVEDIVEEIARIFGFENIPSVFPFVQLAAPRSDSKKLLERKTKMVLRDLGFSEVYNYSFLDERKIRNAGFSVHDHIKLSQTAFEGQPYLRTSLVPGLLLNVAKNILHVDTLQLFELDRVFLKHDSAWDIEPGSEKKLPAQPYHLGGALSAKQGMGFFEAKGIVQNLLESLGFRSTEIEFVKPEKCPTCLNSQETAAILVRKKLIGHVGVVAKTVADAFKIRQSVSLFGIDFDVLAALPLQKPVYTPPAKFPSIVRDLAVVVENTHSAKDILAALRASSPLMVDVKIFDVYRGKGIASSARSLAFRMTYQDKNRTLTDQEVDEAKRRAEGELLKRFGAITRA